jgi:hypothetical protein
VAVEVPLWFLLSLGAHVVQLVALVWTLRRSSLMEGELRAMREILGLPSSSTVHPVASTT